ncbi:uncharacterized protein B0H18DRAFT_1017526 [Fomitopsis serialis]|uniref:uncharacterized protein n=1 Tax=Fomitopsis serialis TaxID=139415 RepID=UPI0020072B9B|nr:uncharacterized protein B0H18DRAFT_1017526 [Neoantrodia serialis]KAH9922459.1 hypothetical protein B0H18DRAFT_1017526 [Neoantrodia serialis]
MWIRAIFLSVLQSPRLINISSFFIVLHATASRLLHHLHAHFLSRWLNDRGRTSRLLASVLPPWTLPTFLVTVEVARRRARTSSVTAAIHR